MIAILMMSTKLAIPGLLKMKYFEIQVITFIIFVTDLTIKIFSRDQGW